MAYLIDGASEEVSFGNYAAIDNLTTHSWSIWVYRNSDGGGGFQRVIDKRQTGDQGHVIWRNDSTTWGYFDFRWTTAEGRWFWPEPPIFTWVNLVLTYDAGSTSNNPVVYYDGVSQTVDRVIGPSGSHTNPDNIELILGNRAAGGRELDGRVALFGVWNRILTPAEAASLAQGKSPDHYPKGLVLDVPLVRNANNKRAGNPGVVTGATVIQQPRMSWRSSQILQFPPVAAVGGVTVAAFMQMKQLSVKSRYM